MKTPKYHKPQNQVLLRDFYVLILRRSCYGLSRRNSLFTGVGCGVENRRNTGASVVASGCSNADEYATNVCLLAGTATGHPTPVDSESMNAIAVTGSAHQSQEKKPAGTLPFMGLPTARLAECGLRDSYTTNPNVTDPVAQWLEQRPYKAFVVGSIPTWITGLVAQWIEHWISTPGVAGSNPAETAMADPA